MIENIFPIKIYKSRFHGNLQIIKNNIISQVEDILKLTEQNNQGYMRKDGLCSYNVCRNLRYQVDIEEIYAFVETELEKYWKELGYLDKGFKIIENWINRYPPGSYIEAHNHAPIALSASFYLQKPEGSGEIIFENPLSTLLKYQPYEFSNIDHYDKWFDRPVSIQEGDLVIFPSYLNHKTEINRSALDRYIIGFNITGI